MNSLSEKLLPNRTVAKAGALIGIAATLGYTLLFIGYAIIRMFMSMIPALPEEELAEALLTTGVSLVFSSLGFGLLASLFSAAAGAIAALGLKYVFILLNPDYRASRALAIGIGVGLVSMGALYLLLTTLFGSTTIADYPELFLFWFLLPGAIFLIACIIGSSKLNAWLSESGKVLIV